jgi:hypothetical protein
MLIRWNKLFSAALNNRSFILSHMFTYVYVFLLSHGSMTALVALGLLYEVSRSHLDTPYFVGLLWTRDRSSERPLPDNKQHSTEAGLQGAGGTRTRNSSNQAAIDPPPRLLGHCERLVCVCEVIKFIKCRIYANFRPQIKTQVAISWAVTLHIFADFCSTWGPKGSMLFWEVFCY